VGLQLAHFALLLITDSLDKRITISEWKFGADTPARGNSRTGDKTGTGLRWHVRPRQKFVTSSNRRFEIEVAVS